MSVPLLFSRIMASPPKMPNVITSGMRICIVVTPKFPNPAFKPSDVPCTRFG